MKKRQKKGQENTSKGEIYELRGMWIDGRKERRREKESKER